MYVAHLPVAVFICRTLSSIFGSIFADSSLGFIFPRSFSEPYGKIKPMEFNVNWLTVKVVLTKNKTALTI